MMLTQQKMAEKIKVKETSCRERTPTGQNVKKRFTMQERKYLVDLAKRHAQVVDCLEVDTASLQEKRSVWFQIKEDFNSVKGHNPRTMKQLKKAWDNHKTKMKRESLGPPLAEEKHIDMLDEDILGLDSEPPSEKRTKGPEPKLMETVKEFKRVTSNGIPKYLEENYDNPDGLITPVVDTLSLRDMKSSESKAVSHHPTQPATSSKSTHNCSLTRPISNSAKMSKRLRSTNVQIGCDVEFLNLLKKEMLISVEIEVIEKKKAEVELKLKEEELTYKRKMWDLEIQLLEKRLKD